MANASIIGICIVIAFCSGCISGLGKISGSNPDAVTQARAVKQETGRLSPESPGGGARTAARAAVSPGSITHRVQWHGETLSIIALWYTGDLDNWEALAAANPTINPHLLYLKTLLTIPGDLVRTRKPMPREFLGQFMKKEESRETGSGVDAEPEPSPQDPPPPAAVPTDDDAIILFGPKGFKQE